jgi:glycoside/pentoside/hexuronide:cation symporter, GPH family
VNGSPLPRASLVAYAALATPLAMAALPVYVHVPKLYGDDLGLSLGVVGTILLAARLLDALQDPMLGWWSDRVAAKSGDRRAFLIAAVPLLALGLIGLFHPPGVREAALAAWLAGCLAVVYIGFSMGAISYFAMGAELSPDYHERTRVTALRGAFGVAGVLIAAALPEWLAGAGDGLGEGLRRFSLLYVPILLIAAAATLFCTPAPRVAQSTNPSAERALWRSLAVPLSNGGFRWLLCVFVASGVASAIPATLILFYVQDVLERPELSGAFLAVYFLFGAAGMPFWVAASRRVGKKRAWLLGMLMSIAAFAWAFLLGHGDAFGFGMVCALSGIAYGAELALPPSILADVIDPERGAGARRPDGAYFGLWQLTEKLNLALAAGLALPLLGAIGYRPGTVQAAMGPLSTMYAIVPCALKLLAVAILWFAPIDRIARTDPASQGGSSS